MALADANTVPAMLSRSKMARNCPRLRQSLATQSGIEYFKRNHFVSQYELMLNDREKHAICKEY